MVSVCRLLELGTPRRVVALRLQMDRHAVQACIDRAAVRWLQQWRQQRTAEEIDRLADLH